MNPDPTYRIERRPLLTFEQWAAREGISLPAESTLTDAIGGCVFPHPSLTRAAIGKLRAKVRELAAYEQAKVAYYQACADGRIPLLEEQVPINPDSPRDQAYLRVVARRAARRGEVP